MEPITLTQVLALGESPEDPFAILVDITKKINQSCFEIKDSSKTEMIMEVQSERMVLRKFTEVGLRVKIVNPTLDLRLVSSLPIYQ